MENEEVNIVAVNKIAQIRRSGKPEEALGLAEQAIAHYEKTNPEASVLANYYCESGACFLALKQYAEADKRYAAAIAKFPDDVYAYTGYAQVALQQGNYLEADKRYAAAIAKFPDDVYAYTGYAKVALQQGNLPEAEKRYAAAVAIFPDNALARKGYAQVVNQAANILPPHEVAQIRRSGKPEEALGLAEQAIAHYEKTNPEASVLAHYYCESGACFLALKQYSEAEKRYASAIKKFPRDAVAHNSYAQVALQQGNYPEAERRFAYVIAKFPDNAFAHNGYAQVALQQGNYSEAEKRFAGAVAKFPNSAFGYTGYAQVALQQGNYAEADKRYADAL